MTSQNRSSRLLLAAAGLALWCAAPSIAAEDSGELSPATTVEVSQVAVDGQLDSERARLVIQADLKGLTGTREKTIVSAAIQHTITVSRDKLTHGIAVKADAVQGELKEAVFILSGEGDVKQVTGERIEDWSVRQAPDGARTLVVRVKKSDPAVKSLSVQVSAETPLVGLPQAVTPFALTGEFVALSHGYVRVDAPAEFTVGLGQLTGVVPVESQFLPEAMRLSPSAPASGVPAFRFHGTAYSLRLTVAVADPEATRVVLSQFELTGQLSGEQAAFTLTFVARVKHPGGGSLALLGGRAALTEANSATNWHWKLEGDRYTAVFDRAGDYPLRLQFDAAIRQTKGWNELEFDVAPSGLAPVVLRGLKPDTEFRFAEAARPERSADAFVSHLPPDGRVRLAWKEARPETEGALFYAAESWSQIAISPGMMRQTALLDFKVMQGELNRVTLRLRGTGEVTRVQGPVVLAWSVEAVPGSSDRRLAVQLNQAQKDQFAFQVQLQTSLGAFPQAIEAVQVQPEGTTRFGGYFRIVNEGAVRLEVLEASGLSQISPEQFPQTDATKALLSDQTTQTFAYRFSGGTFQLRVQADNILPELAVSAVLAYHLAETEVAIDAELEVDVREAPLREMVLRIPKGYAVARLSAPGLSDFFPTESADQPDAQLRLVFGNPVVGRQVLQLRLERNQPLAESAWRLPRIEVVKAKSVRGHVGATADAGFRLTPGATQGLTEIAGGFFPKKLAGIQAAFRLSDAAWQATLNIERLPQSIQADAFHLFSIGEGIAYGSSIINFVISGAPVGTFKIELSAEYFNPEFTGKDVRSWQKVDGGYQVQLHTPVAGSYTLLATYERPFKAQGETLTFTGARPLDAQSEQGHTIVVSAYQFQVVPVNLSTALLPLEPGEVPAEYRLFFDAPILAAYRYTTRPFNLQLELKPLAQGETVSQVVDRASLTTRVSGEGQVVTDARYFVKNKGSPHLRVVTPEATQLWSVSVNGAPVVPVTADRANLIPLPQRADPNTVHEVQLKLAARAKSATRLTVAAPIVAAPILLAEWHLEPDTARRLVYRRGPLTPVGGAVDVAGFGGLRRLLSAEPGGSVWLEAGLALGLTIMAMWVWRLASGGGANRFSVRHVLGGVLGAVAVVMAIAVLLRLYDLAGSARQDLPRDLRFVVPVQQAESALRLEVGNVALGPSLFASAWALAPAVLGAVFWLYSLVTAGTAARALGRALAWVLWFWAALRWPNGASVFFLVSIAFVVLEVALPALWRWGSVARKPSPDTSAGAATASLLLLLGFSLLPAPPAMAQTPSRPATAAQLQPALAESVIQDVRVEDTFVLGAATIRWQAVKGQVLPVLHAPGVLTGIDYPTNRARLVQVPVADRPVQALLAEADGPVDLRLNYQLQTGSRDGERGFSLPTAPGLVNRVNLTLVGLEVEVTAPQAISVLPDATGSATNTLARLVLAPTVDPWIGWKPRSRDTRRERALFYAEATQLYVPGAGVVEGLHQVQLRPAQGELAEVTLAVPEGATITDVVALGLSLWRFDPQTRQLRVRLTPPQAKPFALLIKSQIATGPLPFEQAVGLLRVEGAAGQWGLAGVATGTEVQLDDVRAEALSALNLEDFPGAVLDPLRPAVAGLTLRRAFRYSEPAATLVIEASPVEPDVRVDAQHTLSLGEDRTVLATTLELEVSRAGIFRLSFVLPPALDVESISGGALSHWTELKTDAGRVITLHLKSKTEGHQAFAIGLAGPGVRSAAAWPVPRLTVREASKQTGQLLVVPEQGLRLQVAGREGVTQLDPLKSGVRQKGVLAFRLLQASWTLSLDLERVDAWTQVASLQHVVIGDAQLRVTANLQYEIENTGVKTLRVRLPARAEGVRFRGDQVTDFRALEGPTNGATLDWEIKLNRRVIGKYLLQAAYHVALPEQAVETAILGVEAQDVNLQRGFLTVQAGGRLQVRIEAPPEALQPAEWQSIPRVLQQDLAAIAANYTFRLVEPAYRLPVRLERHAAAKLLPARVTSVALTSVLSDGGIMLTQARVQLVPGDKRLLHLTLPDQARFWFAFVNQGSVWPWRETNQVLIPLEQHSKTGEPTVVEFLYSAQVGTAGARALELDLAGPKFDLPLENITWRVYLGEHWRLTDWSGSLQMEELQVVRAESQVDLATYIRKEEALQREKTKEAQEFLTMANRLLVEGDPEQARRAFTTAYGLSQHDNAFNEDARVQLHNLKMQQALVGLNFREAKVAGEPASQAAAPRALRDSQAPAYTQLEAKQLIERNSAEDNAVQMRLAERLIQQQDAATASPAAIRATVPQQGRLLTFTRPLQVDPWADLMLHLEATAVRPTTAGFRLGVLLGLTLLVGLLVWLGRPKPSSE